MWLTAMVRLLLLLRLLLVVRLLLLRLVLPPLPLLLLLLLPLVLLLALVHLPGVAVLTAGPAPWPLATWPLATWPAGKALPSTRQQPAICASSNGSPCKAHCCYPDIGDPHHTRQADGCTARSAPYNDSKCRLLTNTLCTVGKVVEPA